MKKGLLIILLIFAGLESQSQKAGQSSLFTASVYNNPFEAGEIESAEVVDLLLSTSENKEAEKLSRHKSSLEIFIEKQARKKQKTSNDKFFIKNLFFKIHNKYLKHYKNYVSFDEIFTSGNYDCVTGTALYAIVLDKLGYELHIYESNFHVFLLVELPGDDVLIESTDFYTGYVDDPDQIASRIAHYQLLNNKNEGYYSYQVNNNRFINARQLAGLLYFNLAVDQYNRQQFESAIDHLQKAESLYESSRMTELKGLIHRMIFAGNLE